MRTSIKPTWNVFIVNCITNSCICTFQDMDYKLPKDDTIVSKTCSSVTVCKIIVHLLVLVQNNKRCTVQVLKNNICTLCLSINSATFKQLHSYNTTQHSQVKWIKASAPFKSESGKDFAIHFYTLDNHTHLEAFYLWGGSKLKVL